jgi:hypothetical protein
MSVAEWVRSSLGIGARDTEILTCHSAREGQRTSAMISFFSLTLFVIASNAWQSQGGQDAI